MSAHDFARDTILEALDASSSRNAETVADALRSGDIEVAPGPITMRVEPTYRRFHPYLAPLADPEADAPADEYAHELGLGSLSTRELAVLITRMREAEPRFTRELNTRSGFADGDTDAIDALVVTTLDDTPHRMLARSKISSTAGLTRAQMTAALDRLKRAGIVRERNDIEGFEGAALFELAEPDASETVST